MNFTRCPPDPRLSECPDAGRWPIADRSEQALNTAQTHRGRRGEPLTGTRKRPMIGDER